MDLWVAVSAPAVANDDAVPVRVSRSTHPIPTPELLSRQEDAGRVAVVSFCQHRFAATALVRLPQRERVEPLVACVTLVALVSFARSEPVFRLFCNFADRSRANKKGF